MNTLVRKQLIKAIEWYQRTISPDHGVFYRPTCRFTPTCSEYGKKALMKHGWKGVALTIWRVIRCNPIFTKNGTFEEVP